MEEREAEIIKELEKLKKVEKITKNRKGRIIIIINENDITLF